MNAGWMGLDIGPKAIEQFKEALKGAKVRYLLWLLLCRLDCRMSGVFTFRLLGSFPQYVCCEDSGS